jgi:hypothetical protein
MRLSDLVGPFLNQHKELRTYKGNGMKGSNIVVRKGYSKMDVKKKR